MELREALRRTLGRSGAFLLAPWRELLAGLDRLLAPPASGVALAWVAAGLVAGWWLYVPLHELAHAFGCLAAGGDVTRLEIDPMYGAAILARLVPFVHAGGEYAGRLSGFDTHGSDLVYLATDLAPYLLTIFPGVWWLRRAGRSGRPLLFGAALPCAYAPFLSLSGDAYEIGSLLAVRLPFAGGRRELVGDDLLRQAAELDLSDPALAFGFVAACAFACAWAYGWHRLAAAVAARLGQPRLRAAP